MKSTLETSASASINTTSLFPVSIRFPSVGHSLAFKASVLGAKANGVRPRRWIHKTARPEHRRLHTALVEDGLPHIAYRVAFGVCEDQSENFIWIFVEEFLHDSEVVLNRTTVKYILSWGQSAVAGKVETSLHSLKTNEQ
jgi:hypothetical protein